MSRRDEPVAETVKVVVRAGETVGGVLYFEPTPLDVSTEYGRYLIEHHMADDPAALSAAGPPQMNGDEEVAARATELLGVGPYGPVDAYNAAVERLQGALDRRNREMSAVVADGTFNNPAGEMTVVKRTWRDDLGAFRCRECGEMFRISQEALDATRAAVDDAGTDEEIANTFSFCLSCAEGEEAPGEKVYPTGGGGGVIAPPPDDDMPLCEHCGKEVPPGERFCCDACADDYATLLVFEAKDDEGARYTLDGEAVRLADLLHQNPDLRAEERAAILALQPGDEVLLGDGGAFATFTLRREA